MTQLAGADFRQDSAAFRSMGLRKAALALSLLKVGYHVVMTDADALWLSPPLDFFLSSGIAREADVMASSDSLAPAAEARLVATEAKTEDGAAAWWQEPSVPVTLEQNGNFLDASFNTGVLFFRSNNASRLAVAHWAAAIITEGDTLHGAHTWDDQQAFGELMRMGPEGKSMMYPPTALKLVPGGQGRVFWAMNSRVRLGVLPVGLFANGHTFFVQAAQALPGAPWPVLVHNTFQFFGESGKKARFRAFGLWAAPGADRPGPRERYLTWNATPPAELRGAGGRAPAGPFRCAARACMRLLGGAGSAVWRTVFRAAAQFEELRVEMSPQHGTNVTISPAIPAPFPAPQPSSRLSTGSLARVPQPPPPPPPLAPPASLPLTPAGRAWRAICGSWRGTCCRCGTHWRWGECSGALWWCRDSNATATGALRHRASSPPHPLPPFCCLFPPSSSSHLAIPPRGLSPSTAPRQEP